jgi:hypothetical protein
MSDLIPQLRPAMQRLQDVMNSDTSAGEILSLCCTAILHICRSSPDHAGAVIGQVVASVKAGLGQMGPITRPDPNGGGQS